MNNLSEELVYKYWIDNEIFEETIINNENKPRFIFFEGPPFATGTPHYGHILTGLIKDSVLRYKHNNGYNIPRFASWDTHGLPIEYEIDKDLGIKTTQQIIDYGIAKYNENCRNIVLKYTKEWEIQMGRLGRWIDFKNDFKTMDINFMNTVWWVFKTLYNQGRVYEGVKIMGYSTSCGTSLSNFEVKQNYQEIQDESLYIKLPIKNNIKFNDCFILVWTTTPWTLPTNYCLCIGCYIDYVLVEIDEYRYICAEKLIDNIFNKKKPLILDKFKGDELIGLEYESPFKFNIYIKEYKIISGNFVTDDTGTGIVHISPAYGLDDYNVCINKGIISKESKLFQILDTNGFVNNLIPELRGIFYKNFKDKTNIDLNTWVILELKKNTFYFDKRNFKHNYPFCWRSDTPLIYRATDSLFIKVEDMKNRLLELNKQINWIPKSIGDSRFANWLSDANDWGISRNRFWGTPIPIWKSESGKIICIGSSYELERLIGLEEGSIKDLHRHFIDEIEIIKDGEKYKRIESVFDCWFESGSIPYGTVGQVGIVELLEKYCKLTDSGIKYDSHLNPFIQTDNYVFDNYQSKLIRQTFKILPADFISEGLDQTRGWFYTLLILSASLFDIIPFKNVIVNGLILAEDGKKMSKRLKNYPDPMDIINEYGSDALRLYLLSSQAVRAEQLKFSKSGVHDIKKDIILPLKNSIIFLKEYITLYFNTHNTNPILKIENINISNPINLWILRKYNEIRNDYQFYMDNYDLKNAVTILPKLVQILNNGYIKIGRFLIKGKESHEEWIQSLSVFYYLIKFILNDFKSVMPFFCESQFLELNDFMINNFKSFNLTKSIHLLESENYIVLESLQIAKSIDFDIIYNIITQIYFLRSSNDISHKKPVKMISLIWDDRLVDRYSNRFIEYLGIIIEECNLLDIQILKKDQVNISKSIVPIKSEFFKKYGKDILLSFNKLTVINSNDLDLIINIGQFDGFDINSTMFNYNYNVSLIDQESSDLVYKEFDFGDYKDKIIILMDKSWTELNDKIYYYRLIATSIQKSRKNAGLHTWDEVTALWDGDPKYNLNSDEALNYIEKITRIKFIKYYNNLDLSKIIYSSYFDNIKIKLFLIK